MHRETTIYMGKKLFELILTLLIVTVISFVLLTLSPVDPAEAYARRSFAMVGANEAQLEEIREEMGLNDPIFIQYMRWAKDAIQLEFGKSLVSGQDVFPVVIDALFVTLRTVILSGAIQIVFILLLAPLYYLCRKSFAGHILNFLCIAGISIPPFFFASSFIDVFAVQLRWISVTGESGIMRYLPSAICLAIGCVAFFSQLLARNLSKEMNTESTFYGRCRGLSDIRILARYALPQAVVTILPSFCQMLGLCMAGAAIVEQVFSLPGLGYLIIRSVVFRDAPLIHATILFLAFGLAIFNIISDILCRILERNPANKEGFTYEKNNGFS